MGKGHCGGEAGGSGAYNHHLVLLHGWCLSSDKLYFIRYDVFQKTACQMKCVKISLWLRGSTSRS
jgi:hypothetical protein